MEVNNNSIIGDLVADNYRYASVFKKNGIDFCCNGQRTIEQACEVKKVDMPQLIEDLKQSALIQQDGQNNYNQWPLDLLADYIEKTHHRYVETRIPEIKPFLKKVAAVHGDRHPELREIEQLFTESANELTTHMKKEELMLFPYIRRMVQSKSQGESIEAPFGTVQNPIRMMMHEHDIEGERFRKIEELTDHYTPPQDACNTYRVTYALLQEFENDLHMHIHLENNILFPKSIELEEQL